MGKTLIEVLCGAETPSPPPEASEAARLLAARRQPRQRPCAHCATLCTVSGRGKYCSPACRSLAWAKKRRAEAKRPRGRPRRRTEHPAPAATPDRNN